MKRIVKIISTLVILLVVSCSKEISEPFISSEIKDNRANIPTRSSNCFEQTPFCTILKENKITIDFVPTIISGFLDKKDFKNTDSYSIDVVSKNGRNLMFVVNFEGGGWVIVSGRYDIEHQILAFNHFGDFNPNEIASPECKYWFDSTCETIEQAMMSDEERNSFDLRDFDYTHFWVLVPIEPQYSSVILSNVSSFIPTKWGQGSPWNYKCPSINGVKCRTGCVAVAYAQIFYYLHNSIGKPNKIYHQIDTCYSWEGSYYLPHHSASNLTINSPRWAAMPLTNPGSQTAGTNYVGDLMIEIGQYWSMKYAWDGSSTYPTPTNLQQYYNINASGASPFIPAETISQLENNLPVLIDGEDLNNGEHAWIIDGYKRCYITEDRLSQWKRLPVSAINEYNGFVCYNDDEMRLFFPNVIENQLVHSYSYYYTTEFSMNWGWDGEYDGYYQMSDINYSNGNLMVYGFN